MNSKEKEFYLHKHYGISKPTNTVNVSKPKENVYELSDIRTGQRLIHGEYSLCRWKQNQLPSNERKNYVICKIKR